MIERTLFDFYSAKCILTKIYACTEPYNKKLSKATDIKNWERDASTELSEEEIKITDKQPYSAFFSLATSETVESLYQIFLTLPGYI